jgi:hypothetical protein
VRGLLDLSTSVTLLLQVALHNLNGSIGGDALVRVSTVPAKIISSTTKNNLNHNFFSNIMHYDSIYIYGIVDGQANVSFNVPGIGDRNDTVYCIPFKDVTAIVSETPFEEYDPTEENSLAHEKVIQEVLKEGFSIAPMRFCTILRNKDEIFELCQSCYLPFKRNILRIRNKQEFSVKTFLNVDKLQAEVSTEDELLEKSKMIASELYTLLKEICFDNVLDEQSTREMIFNCSFLIHKDKIEEFYTAITQFDQQYTDKLKIRISGPTAPYNFVDMPTKPI